jgi:hypothetical protein
MLQAEHIDSLSFGLAGSFGASYNRARYYDQSIGRFLSVDLSGFSGDFIFDPTIRLTPFDTNWNEGSGATPLTIQDLFYWDAISHLYTREFSTYTKLSLGGNKWALGSIWDNYP